MTPQSTRDIDTAIAEAAQRLTQTGPTGFMRARVLARIGDRRPARSPWLAAAAAAVVLVAVGAAVTWLRLDRAGVHRTPQTAFVPPPAAIPSTSADRPAPEAPAVTASGTDAVRAPSRRAVRHSQPDSATAPVSAAEAAWRAGAVPPLPEPAPIVLESSQPEALVVPLLELKPLATSPVVLAPIGDGRQ